MYTPEKYVSLSVIVLLDKVGNAGIGTLSSEFDL